MTDAERDYLDKYVILIKNFIDGKITAPEFEKEYILVHRGDKYRYPNGIGEAIYTLYSDVDEYCSIPELFEPGDLDAVQLLGKACIAYERLKVIGIL